MIDLVKDFVRMIFGLPISKPVSDLSAFMFLGICAVVILISVIVAWEMGG